MQKIGASVGIGTGETLFLYGLIKIIQKFNASDQLNNSDKSVRLIRMYKLKTFIGRILTNLQSEKMERLSDGYHKSLIAGSKVVRCHMQVSISLSSMIIR